MRSFLALLLALSSSFAFGQINPPPPNPNIRFTGPTPPIKTFTLPNANANILTDNSLVTPAQGGTGNAFFGVSGLTALRNFTFPDISSTVFTSANFPVTATQTFYLQDTASAVATYKKLLSTPYSPKTTEAYTPANGTHVIQNWITEPGSPGQAFYPAGIYEFHVHADKAGGTATIYGEFWETDAAGADIALIDTTASAVLTNSEVEYVLVFDEPNVYTPVSSSSRIALRVWAITASLPTVNIFVGGTADSHIEFPRQALNIPIIPAQGGTGVINNNASTLAISGNFATTLTVTGATGVTFPTTGTLSTLAGAETLSNKTITNPALTSQPFPVTATSAWNFALGNMGTATLVNSISTLTFSNPPAAGTFAFDVVQGGTGSYTVAWPASVKWPGGTAPTLTTAVGSHDLVSCATFDTGTTYRCNALLDIK